MADNRYPKELHHPNGYRHLMVYSIEEERAANRHFADMRAGRVDFNAPIPEEPEEPVRRGPARSRKEDVDA